MCAHVRRFPRRPRAAHRHCIEVSCVLQVFNARSLLNPDLLCSPQPGSRLETQVIASSAVHSTQWLHRLRVARGWSLHPPRVHLHHSSGLALVCTAGAQAPGLVPGMLQHQPPCWTLLSSPSLAWARWEGHARGTLERKYARVMRRIPGLVLELLSSWPWRSHGASRGLWADVDLVNALRRSLT